MLQMFIDLFLNLDKHLAEFVASYGSWIYGLLFTIVFCETGLVVTPFLPGDSLLFAAGAIAAAGGLDPWLVGLLLIVAAVSGDAVNYSVGRYVGPRVFRAEDLTGFWHKVLNRKHLDRAHAFFERYGGKAIALGRFVPIVRTFVPFVAGAGSMTYRRFALYNIGGGIAWVTICVGSGYAFGEMPFVKKNFSLVALAIIFISVLPIMIELLQEWRRKKRGVAGTPSQETPAA
jgi:membrane-associated protein